MRPTLSEHPLGSPGARQAPPGPKSRALAAELTLTEAPLVSGVAPGRQPIVWESARGARVRDVDGNVYVDLAAGFGVVNVGHAHPAVTAAVREQAERLLHGFGDVHPHERRVALAGRLAHLAPLPDARVYFATSGSEAVEIALKTAHLVTGRPGVAAFTGGYHGLSYGALRATARAEFREPFAEALGAPTLRLPFPDPYRPPIDTAPHRLAEACLEVARRELRAGARRGSLPGAIVVEPVQGREGVIVPPEGWLRELSALSREAGTLLVVDEVLTGFGRTGAWFAVQREGVVPDVLVLGKGMGGGMPVAAAVAAGALFSVWERPGEALHTSTFLAHPLACAAALAALEVLERERLVERAAAWEATLGTDLRRLAIRRGVGDVRGRGMMWAVELVRHPSAGRGAVPGVPATPDPQAAGALVAACLRRGVLVLAGGSHGNVLQVTPPLVLSADEWAFALEALQDALAECE